MRFRVNQTHLRTNSKGKSLLVPPGSVIELTPERAAPLLARGYLSAEPDLVPEKPVPGESGEKQPGKPGEKQPGKPGEKQPSK